MSVQTSLNNERWDSVMSPRYLVTHALLLYGLYEALATLHTISGTPRYSFNWNYETQERHDELWRRQHGSNVSIYSNNEKCTLYAEYFFASINKYALHYIIINAKVCLFICSVTAERIWIEFGTIGYTLTLTNWLLFIWVPRKRSPASNEINWPLCPRKNHWCVV